MGLLVQTYPMRYSGCIEIIRHDLYLSKIRKSLTHMPIRYFGLAQSATIFPERLAKVANRYNRIPMAVFNPNEASDQQLNWTIPRDGGVALYRSSGYLSSSSTRASGKGLRHSRLREGARR